MTPGQEIEQTLMSVLSDALQEGLRSGRRSEIEERLVAWLDFTARKKPVSDLEQRLEQMRKRIHVLAQSLDINCESGVAVVKASGESDSTLKMLERGTDWFDPADDVTEIIVAAVLG